MRTFCAIAWRGLIGCSGSVGFCRINPGGILRIKNSLNSRRLEPWRELGAWHNYEERGKRVKHNYGFRSFLFYGIMEKPTWQTFRKQKTSSLLMSDL